MKKIPQDIIGNIAILKFPKQTFLITKKIKALMFLKHNKNITTIVEKTGKFSGQLRIPTTKYLSGEKTTIATYKENNCTFKFDINKTYFSPRLSNERKIIADEIVKLSKKKGTKILIMFAGIAPYPIVIAKKLKQANKSAIIYSNELNKEANKSAKENIILNKLQKNIILIPGNAKQLPQLLTKLYKSRPTGRNIRLSTTDYRLPTKFNIIIMPRPNLKETFLKTTLELSEKGTTIFYHGFGTKEKVLNEIKKNTKNKIGKIKIRKAGDIGAYKYRWQTMFKIK